MYYNGVWCDERHAEITYNWAYHFYDVILYPSGKDTVARLVERFSTLCKRDGVSIRMIDPHWYRWVEPCTKDAKQIEGVRIWINPEGDTLE